MIKKQKNSTQPLPTNLTPNLVQRHKRSISQKQEELNFVFDGRKPEVGQPSCENALLHPLVSQK